MKTKKQKTKLVYKEEVRVEKEADLFIHPFAVEWLKIICKRLGIGIKLDTDNNAALAIDWDSEHQVLSIKAVRK